MNGTMAFGGKLTKLWHGRRVDTGYGKTRKNGLQMAIPERSETGTHRITEIQNRHQYWLIPLYCCAEMYIKIQRI